MALIHLQAPSSVLHVSVLYFCTADFYDHVFLGDECVGGASLKFMPGAVETQMTCVKAEEKYYQQQLTCTEAVSTLTLFHPSRNFCISSL